MNEGAVPQPGASGEACAPLRASGGAPSESERFQSQYGIRRVVTAGVCTLRVYSSRLYLDHGPGVETFSRSTRTSHSPLTSLLLYPRSPLTSPLSSSWQVIDVTKPTEPTKLTSIKTGVGSNMGGGERAAGSQPLGGSPERPPRAAAQRPHATRRPQNAHGRSSGAPAPQTA